MSSKNITNLIFISLSFIILFSSFQHNFFRKKNGKGFSDSKIHAWMAGSILNDRAKGFGNNITFTSIWMEKGMSVVEAKEFSSKAYRFKGGEFSKENGNWYVYKSAMRTQYLFYRLIDAINYRLTGNHKNLFSLFRMIAMLFYIITIILFLIWIAKEFHISVAFSISILLCFSNWMRGGGMGSNLWMYSIPCFIGLHLFRKKYRFFDREKSLHLALYGGLSTLFFTLNAYEFVPVAMLALLIPIVFYNDLLTKEGSIRLFRECLIVGIGALIGFFITILLHIGSLYLIENNWQQAFDFLEKKYTIRTSGENMGEMKSNIDSKKIKSAFSVIGSYLRGKAILFKLNVWKLLLCFLVASLFGGISYAVKGTLSDTEKNNWLKLGISTIFSFIGTVAFFIIFKAHAIRHPHLDYVVFTLFFLFFMLAFITYTFYLVFSKIILKRFPDTWVSLILYFIAIIPLLHSLETKYEISEKITFNLRDEKLFDFNDRKQKYRFKMMSTVIKDNILYTKSKKNRFTFQLKNIEDEIIILKTRFHSNKNGLFNLYKDSCKHNNKFKSNNNSEEILIQKGWNDFYLELDVDECFDIVRVDFINRKDAIIKIEEFVIK